MEKAIGGGECNAHAMVIGGGGDRADLPRNRKLGARTRTAVLLEILKHTHRDPPHPASNGTGFLFSPENKRLGSTCTCCRVIADVDVEIGSEKGGSRCRGDCSGSLNPTRRGEQPGASPAEEPRGAGKLLTNEYFKKINSGRVPHRATLS